MIIQLHQLILNMLLISYIIITNYMNYYYFQSYPIVNIIIISDLEFLFHSLEKTKIFHIYKTIKILSILTNEKQNH